MHWEETPPLLFFGVNYFYKCKVKLTSEALLEILWLLVTYYGSVQISHFFESVLVLTAFLGICPCHPDELYVLSHGSSCLFRVTPTSSPDFLNKRRLSRLLGHASSECWCYSSFQITNFLLVGFLHGFCLIHLFIVSFLWLALGLFCLLLFF